MNVAKNYSSKQSTSTHNNGGGSRQQQYISSNNLYKGASSHVKQDRSQNENVEDIIKFLDETKGFSKLNLLDHSMTKTNIRKNDFN